MRPITHTYAQARAVCGYRVALLLFGGMLLVIAIAYGANPQSYRVELSPTGNGALDAILKDSSQLIALRADPVDGFGLIARARGDLARLKTAIESFGYYQSSVAITIDGTPLDEPALGDTLNALPAGKVAVCHVSFTLGPLYHIGRIDIDGSV